MSWLLLAAVIAATSVFSALRSAEKLAVTVTALRSIADGQPFAATVAWVALRDAGELDEEPDA